MKHITAIIIILCISSILIAEFQAPNWSRNLSIYEVNVRQYTEEGTFTAFRQHLPRLQEMGVGILWLMPINPISILNRKGSLGSYYASSDYLAINPEYGTEADFKHLVEDIHARGMYVIIDWVANHTGWDNVWTTQHPEYYKKNDSGNFYPPVQDWADVIGLDYNNAGLREAMTQAMEYWVREFDIDGFRCDVAAMVPLNFWLAARERLEEIKPVFMLAECENPNYHQAFDMTYAWSGFGLFKDIANGYKKVIELDAYQMRERIKYDVEDYRMLFLSNHDENSWSASMMDHFPDSYKAMTVLTYALPGMPLIYSGQEAKNTRELAFFDKDMIEWQTTEMDTLYKLLNILKKQYSQLNAGIYGGRINKVANSQPYQVYSFTRTLPGQELLFIINLSVETQELHLIGIDATYTDYLDFEIIDINPESIITLSPWDYKILIKDY